MSHYANPTENAALGAFTKDWNRMTRKANRIRQRRLEGTLTARDLVSARGQFRGIYRILLTKAMTQDEEIRS